MPKGRPHDWDHHDIAVHNRMCRTLGGDFYDFIRINSQQMAVVIGDVIGHGVSASLVMAQIMGFLRSGEAKLTRPGQVVQALNHLLIEQGRSIGMNLLCSIFYAVLDAPSHVCFYVNAGHPLPLLGRNDDPSIDFLGPHDMLLGVQEFTPVDQCMTLSPGHRMVLYTDGVVDVINSAEEHLGWKQMERVMSKFHDQSAERLVKEVFSMVEEFRSECELCDDQSLVVIDRC